MCGLLGAAPAARAAAPDRPVVVVVAVPGLLWSDVQGMPALSALAAQSSVGELSVKTAHLPTSCPAGLLAVSAGNRTTTPTSSCAIDLSSWPALAHANSTSRYAATIGALGSTLQAHGVPTVAVTAAARPMLANRSGAVDVVAPSLAAALTTGGVIGVLDQRLYDVPPGLRPAAAAAVDAHIAAIQHVLPPSAVLMVAGISDLAAGPAQLHAIVMHGPGWAHTQLRSSSTGRAPYVQLIDIAPTILAAVGITEPDVMVGRAMQQSGSSVPSLARYVDDDRHARDQRSLGQRVFLVLGIAAILMMALAATPIPLGQRLAGWLARADRCRTRAGLPRQHAALVALAATGLRRPRAHCARLLLAAADHDRRPPQPDRGVARRPRVLLRPARARPAHRCPAAALGAARGQPADRRALRRHGQPRLRGVRDVGVADRRCGRRPARARTCRPVRGERSRWSRSSSTARRSWATTSGECSHCSRPRSSWWRWWRRCA